MKAYKKLSSARAAAKGLPIVMISNGTERLYITVDDSLASIERTEVCLLTGQGSYAGHITLRHLDRLGNGNWAIERPEYSSMPAAFPKDGGVS